MTTIALCIICKDELDVIERLIKNVSPLVDFYLIVDTGSTDGTQAAAVACFHEYGLAGEVVHEPFRDFAYNRTFAVECLRNNYPDIDYCLMIDADEQLIFDEGFNISAFKSSLVADAYDIQTRHGTCWYNRQQLFSNHKPFYFRGVLHEFLDCRERYTRETAKGFFNLYGVGEGARSKNSRKFFDDAHTLAAALQVEDDPFLIARYTYYLANSWRDAGEIRRALPLYMARSLITAYWQDEVYISLLNAARIKERLGYPFADVLALYIDAMNVKHNRGEAFLGAMYLCRSTGRHLQAYLYGSYAVNLPLPASSCLFVETSAYLYAIKDELAVSANNIGRYSEAARLCSELLDSGSLPAAWIERVNKNRLYALSKIECSAVAV